MKLWTSLTKNKIIKNSAILLGFSLFIRLIVTLCNIFVDYLYIIEFINWRLFFILCILVLMQILLDLPFVKDFHEEVAVFNEGPANKSSFITFLREYHFSLILLTFLSYTFAVTYFVEDPLISYLLGIISFISLILYLVQFVVYTNTYIKKSFISSKSRLKKDTKKGSTRKVWIHTGAVKRAAVVCLECAKAGLAITGGAELTWKLTNGGMNAVSPPRQFLLNQAFPDDRTKVWTESKAAMALHNQAMGNPHDKIYDSKFNVEHKFSLWPK